MAKLNGSLVMAALFPNDEVWATLPNYPGYEVSTKGRVLSYWGWVTYGDTRTYTITSEPQRLLTITIEPKEGRSFAMLRKIGRQYRQQVAALILEAFVGPRPSPKLDCRHLSGDPTDNKIENLAWGTRSQNQIDMVYHGSHPLYRLRPVDIPLIRSRLAQGDRQQEIAANYGVARQAISAIKTGRSWAHIA